MIEIRPDREFRFSLVPLFIMLRVWSFYMLLEERGNYCKRDSIPLSVAVTVPTLTAVAKSALPMVFTLK